VTDGQHVSKYCHGIGRTFGLGDPYLSPMGGILTVSAAGVLVGFLAGCGTSAPMAAHSLPPTRVDRVVPTTVPPTTVPPTTTTQLPAPRTTVAPTVLYETAQAPTGPGLTANPYVGPFTTTSSHWHVNWWVTDCSFGGELLDITIIGISAAGEQAGDLSTSSINTALNPTGSGVQQGGGPPGMYQLDVQSPQCNWSVEVVQS